MAIRTHCDFTLGLAVPHTTLHKGRPAPSLQKDGAALLKGLPKQEVNRSNDNQVPKECPMLPSQGHKHAPMGCI